MGLFDPISTAVTGVNVSADLADTPIRQHRQHERCHLPLAGRLPDTFRGDAAAIPGQVEGTGRRRPGRGQRGRRRRGHGYRPGQPRRGAGVRPDQPAGRQARHGQGGQRGPRPADDEHDAGPERLRSQPGHHQPGRAGLPGGAGAVRYEHHPGRGAAAVVPVARRRDHPGRASPSPTSPTSPTAPVGGAGAAGGAGGRGQLRQRPRQCHRRRQSTQANADNLATQAATGSLTNVSDYMVAAEEANIQTQLTSAVRNNALQAFQQIMGMQL